MAAVTIFVVLDADARFEDNVFHLASCERRELAFGADDMTDAEQVGAETSVRHLRDTYGADDAS